MQEELFSKIREVIIDLDEQNLVTLTEEAIESKVDPVEAIDKG